MNFISKTNRWAVLLFIFLMAPGLMLLGCAKEKNSNQLDQKVITAEKKPANLEKLLHPNFDEMNKPAPEVFKIKFETSKGNFLVEVHRSWSPFGADRLFHLVKNQFYDDVRFFRVIAGFMAQFGFHGNPEVSKIWSDLNFPDDPVRQSNKRGFVSFAKSNQPNSRSTHLFINYVDNSRLDAYGFSPVGQVIEGMDVVDKLYSGYGEGAPAGSGPSQGRIHAEGNAYLNKDFPKLDYIKTARIVTE